MPDTLSALAALLGADELARFQQTFPDRVFVARDTRLPDWLRDPNLCDLSHWSKSYGGRIEVTRGNNAQYAVSGASLSAWVEDLGLAAHLPKLELHLPQAAKWLSTLESELSLPPGCTSFSAFFNAPSIGLGPHCDPCEHMLLHLRGTKLVRWVDAEPLAYRSVSYSPTLTPHAADTQQFPQGFPSWREHLPHDAREVTLTPGSLLLLPRGCYHETRGGDDDVSITFVVQMRIPSLAHVLLGYLREHLLRRADFRTPVLPNQRARLERALADAPALPSLDALLRHAHRKPDAWHEGSCFVQNPALQLVQTDGQGLSIVGEGVTKPVLLSVRACGLAQDMARQAQPIPFAQLRAQFSHWDERSFMAVLGFLVKQRVLLAVESAHGASLHPSLLGSSRQR